MTDDLHRPRYHFLPPSNWMNDPNGLIQFDGWYHLFYQHNPEQAWWGTMHWGHARSRNLVDWEHLPIALQPTSGGYDKNGCFSGCAVDNDGVPTLIYTGVEPQVQCVATGTPDLVTWTKHRANPVLAAPPKGFDPADFRDPYVWMQDGQWLMVVGARTLENRGAALLYRSEDLTRWEFLNPLLQAQTEAWGRVWECPNFFQLGDKWVLLVSPVPLGRTIYFIGQFEGNRFLPEDMGDLDRGGSFYAPQTFLDTKGRRLLFGWLREDRIKEEQLNSGWSGAQTLPRVLSLADDGSLRQEPASEVELLRGSHRRINRQKVTPENPIRLTDLRSDLLEIKAVVDPGDAMMVGLRFPRMPDLEEQTFVLYDCRNGGLSIDRSVSSLDPHVNSDECRCDFHLAEGEFLDLRVFLDRSVIEVYANGRACLTARIYPTLPEGTGPEFLSMFGASTVRSLDVWELRPAEFVQAAP